MSAKPWPHGWSAGMRRLRPTTGQSWRASRAWDQDEGGGSLRWKQEPGGPLSDSEAPWPRDVPDLDDGPTKGALLEKVREARGDPWYSLDAFTHPDPAIGTRWYEPVTGRGFAHDGTAYVAALDRLEERASS